MKTRSHGVGAAVRCSALDAGLTRRMLAVSLLGLGLGMICRPAFASNNNVLIIYDEISPNTLSLAAALESAGLQVTLSDTNETAYTGANPSPIGFAAVIHLNGTTYLDDMPRAGQQALVSYVQAGGGYVHSQWDSLEFFGFIDGAARMVDMRDLILFDTDDGADSDSRNVPLTYNVVPGREGHPVLANVPPSFSFASGWNIGLVHPFSSNPATVLMRDPWNDDAVAVREFGSGRVVGFNHAGNYRPREDVSFDVLSNAHIQRLYVNGARWAGRIQENRPPVANPGSYGVIEATGTSTPVALDGGASYDPDGDQIMQYRWSEGGTPLGTGLTLGVNLSLGIHPITLTVIDPAGLSGSASVGVTVVDTTPPSFLGVPSNLTVEATGPAGATVTFPTPTATDAVSGAVPVSCSPASGATFPLGTTTVACTATDGHGNTATATFNVTVQDTTPPAITGADDVTVEATGPGGAAATFSASATDQVDGPVAVAYSTASGSTFPLGDTAVTASATDAHGNTATKSFRVSVVDTTAPTFSSTPADVTAEATGPEGATVAFSAPQATDRVGPVTVTCSPASGSVFPLGATTVTCTATDASGNTATTSFTVHVEDTTAPAISLPGDLTLEATGASGAAAAFTVSAADRVDGSVPVSCSPASGSVFPLGTTTVACHVTDSHGNTATASFTVTVKDTTAPAIAALGDLTVEATGPGGAPATFAASATDAVDGDVPVHCSPASGGTFPLGTTTVTCTATDAHGNTASKSFHVNVVDTTPPAVTVPGDTTATATSAAGAAVSFTASATDAVSGPVSVSCSPASGSTFPLGTTTVTCTATDAAGNRATRTFQVTVAYAWSGVLPPIKQDGSSVFRQGRTVPVKFRLAGASAGIANAVARLYVTHVCPGTHDDVNTEDCTEEETDGFVFRYDSCAGQYIYNLRTRNLEPGTYQLRIDLGDGVTRTVNIGLR
jgi:hypothetical protein